MHKLAAYGLAPVFVAVATLLTVSFTAVRLKSPYLLLVIAIMASAASGGFAAGIFALLLSCVAAVYFLLGPVGTFEIADPENITPLTLFGVVGVAITWGVTLLTRAREQAEESRERFHSAFVDAHIGFAQVDASGGMIEVNRAFCEIAGYAEQELLGKQLRAITHPEDIAESAQIIDQVATRQLPSAVYEKRYLRKDGSTIWVRVSAATVVGPRGKVPNQVITLVEDITQAKRLELEFLQAQKMEAVGRLAGGVAHDFNNLLTVIAGYCHILLANETAVPGAMRDPIRQIAESADRAAELTGQLLAFSRQRATRRQNVQLNSVVANLERMLKRIIGEDVELVLSLDSASGQIWADPAQIEQVIMNLAINARDAMPRGGLLMIKTEGVVVDDALASWHFGLTPGEHVLLSISDNGCGMTAEVQAHAFEPFFTTKEPGKGTGLGLSTVYGIVQQHGGKIVVYSEGGRGATFKLFFPKLQAAAEPQNVTSSVQSSEQASRPGTETILLVEDERGVREYVRAVLAQLGYTLLEATDGVAALEVAHNHPGNIGLLLSDIVMPRMNGPQLASRLRELRPGLRVLYMSGYSELSVKADLAPGEGVIQKPFSPTAIAERVRDLLDQS